MPAETTQMAFTDAQVAWLERWLEKRCPAAGRSLDRATQMWITGGLTALGVVAFGVLWTEIGSLRAEIGSVRAEIGSVRAELQQEIGSVRAEIGSVQAEIGSVRAEIGSARAELQQEIHENRAAILELAKGQARIEAILDERLPRPG